MRFPFPLVRCALIVLASAATLFAGESEQELRARTRIDARLAEWRAGKVQNPEQLCDELVSVGNIASPYLCRLLDEQRSELPIDPVARAVGRLGRVASLPTLERLVKAPEVENRTTAVGALGLFQCEEALQVLCKALDDPELDVADKAEATIIASKVSLARVSRIVSHHLIEAKDKYRPALVLGHLGGETAHELLLGHLGASDEPQCLAALQGLAILALPEDGPAVDQLLRERTTPVVRREACLFLGRLKHGPSVRILVDLLHDDEPGLAPNAWWALQQITGLELEQNADLWEFWWNRVGKKIYGPHAEPGPRPEKN